jgi:hypothetical protein
VVHGHEVEPDESAETEGGVIAPQLVFLHQQLNELVQDEGAAGGRRPVVVVIVLTVFVVVGLVVVVAARAGAVERSKD